MDIHLSMNFGSRAVLTEARTYLAMPTGERRSLSGRGLEYMARTVLLNAPGCAKGAKEPEDNALGGARYLHPQQDQRRRRRAGTSTSSLTLTMVMTLATGSSKQRFNVVIR